MPAFSNCFARLLPDALVVAEPSPCVARGACVHGSAARAGSRDMLRQRASCAIKRIVHRLQSVGAEHGAALTNVHEIIGGMFAASTRLGP